LDPNDNAAIEGIGVLLVYYLERIYIGKVVMQALYAQRVLRVDEFCSDRLTNFLSTSNGEHWANIRRP